MPIAELHMFPAQRIIRPAPTDDTVTVTHQGVTHTYDCPSDLHAAVLTFRSAELEAVEKARAMRRCRLTLNRVRRRQWKAIEGAIAGLQLAGAIGAAMIAVGLWL